MDLPSLIATFGVLVAAVVASEVLVFILNNVIKPLTARTKTTLDDWLIEAAAIPIRLFGLAIGLFLTGMKLYPGTVLFNQTIEFWFSIVLIILGGYTVARLLNSLIMWYYTELSPEVKAKAKIKVNQDLFPIARRVVKILIYIGTAIVVLDRFGIEITPILTGLGIAGLAVALALKDTLANFFAGVSLLTDKPIRVGDYIALDNEQGIVKGFVEEIGWRTTRIRTRGNYVYFIPNEKITLSNVVNFSRGQGTNWKGASLAVGVAYHSDVRKVEATLIEAVRNVQRKDDRMVKTCTPQARLESFGPSSLDFKVLYEVNNVFDADAVAGEVRKEILAQFKKKKISIPYPVLEIRR